MRLRRYKNHLGITHPELAATLHPTKNHPYQIENLTQGSERIVWWLCPCCKTEWSYSIFKRVRGKGKCPSCCPKEVPLHKSLGYQYPKLKKDWHPVKNSHLTPYKVSACSAKKVWWKCSTCSHEWLTSVYSRSSNNTGCPSCARKKHHEYLREINRVERENNLSITHSYLEAAWDSEKNYPLLFKHVSSGSRRITWWKCKHCQHSFSKRTFSLVSTPSLHICKNCNKSIY